MSHHRDDSSLGINGDGDSGAELCLEPPADAGVDPPEDDPTTAAHVTRRAEALVASLLDGDAEARAAVDGLGTEVQRGIARRTTRVHGAVIQAAGRSARGGSVAETLEALHHCLEGLDPGRYNLAGEGWSRLLARLPGVRTPLERYFRRFEGARDRLTELVRTLETGRLMLWRDNITLADDQTALRGEARDLAMTTAVVRQADQRLAECAAREAPQRREIIEQELLLPLRQRLVDLQQQRAVAEQALLALEVTVRNNRELIRAIDRARDNTVTAVHVAMAAALALTNRRLALDAVVQGAGVESASGPAAASMTDVAGAVRRGLVTLTEVSRYRDRALPQVQERIRALEQALPQDSPSVPPNDGDGS